MPEVSGRFIAGLVIVSLSSAVMYQACQRASTIYFFEMNTVNTIFIHRREAFLFPLLLSLFIFLGYWTTKRTLIVEEKLRIQRLKEKAKSSRPASRKPSYSYATTGETTRKTSFSVAYSDDSIAEQAKRLRRLLSAIEEQDTIQATRNHHMNVEDSDTKASSTPPNSTSRFTVESVGDTLRCPSDPLGGLRHRTSSRRNSDKLEDLVNDACTENGDVEDDIDPYQRLVELDSCSYLWSLLNFSPSGNTDMMSPMDILSELVAVHIPIWGCVAALYVVLLEVLNIKLAYYFYYHGNFMGYCALIAAVACGVIHEFKKNCLTNNILAFASVYVSIARFQVVSYQTAVIFAVGLVAIDLFWFYVIDILSTVMQNKEAPVFISIPCDFNGNTQRLTTPTIIAPAIVLGVVLKYSSMYDTHLYMYTFYAVVVSVAVMVIVDIIKGIMLPGIILPATTAVLSSLIAASHREDLWRFAIKH